MNTINIINIHIFWNIFIRSIFQKNKYCRNIPWNPMPPYLPHFRYNNGGPKTTPRCRDTHPVYLHLTKSSRLNKGRIRSSRRRITLRQARLISFPASHRTHEPRWLIKLRWSSVSTLGWGQFYPLRRVCINYRSAGEKRVGEWGWGGWKFGRHDARLWLLLRRGRAYK